MQEILCWTDWENLRRKEEGTQVLRTGQQSNALFINIRDTKQNVVWENCKKVTSKSSVDRNLLLPNLIKHTSEENFNFSEGLLKLDNYIVGKISKNVLSTFNLL